MEKMYRVQFVYDYAVIGTTLETDSEDEEAIAEEAMDNLVQEFGMGIKGPYDWEVEEIS